MVEKYVPDGPVATVGRSVYFIGVPDGHVKIGLSANPADRIAGLQTGNHQEIVFYGATQIEDFGVCPREMERRIHELLEQHHVRGEWFLAPYETVVRAWQLAWLSLRLDRVKPMVDNSRGGSTPRKKSRHGQYADKEKRREYMREYMRKKRTFGKGKL